MIVRKFSVPPNHGGLLYRKNIFVRVLEPGIFRILDPLGVYSLHNVPVLKRLSTVGSQEVLTKDNIAFRLSYSFMFQFSDLVKASRCFDIASGSGMFLAAVDQLAHARAQIELRAVVASVDSEDLVAQRDAMVAGSIERLKPVFAEVGLEPVYLMLRDVSFPKNIQDLFARQLEAKIRAKTDLENARTQVAAARALKNAAEIIKSDDRIQSLLWIDALSKIAAKGNHTFVLGEGPWVKPG